MQIRPAPFPLLALAVLFASLGGCLSGTGLPDQLDVALTATEKQIVAADTGPRLLAGATWALFRAEDKADTAAPLAVAADDPPLGPYGGLLNGGILERPPNGAQIFRLVLNDDGRLTRVLENKYFLTAVYGEEVPVGGGSWPTVLPGVRFESASFGVSVGDRFGLAVFVEVNLLGVRLGDAILYAWGVMVDGRADGTFGYQLDFSDSPAQSILKSGGDQYPFFATRE